MGAMGIFLRVGSNCTDVPRLIPSHARYRICAQSVFQLSSLYLRPCFSSGRTFAGHCLDYIVFSSFNRKREYIILVSMTVTCWLLAAKTSSDRLASGESAVGHDHVIKAILYYFSQLHAVLSLSGFIDSL